MKKERKSMSSRFPVEILDRVAVIAANEHRSVTGQILYIIDEALKVRALDREEAKEETA